MLYVPSCGIGAAVFFTWLLVPWVALIGCSLASSPRLVAEIIICYSMLAHIYIYIYIYTRYMLDYDIIKRHTITNYNVAIDDTLYTISVVMMFYSKLE